MSHAASGSKLKITAESHDLFYSYNDHDLHKVELSGAEGELSVHFLEMGNKYTGDCTYIKVGDIELHTGSFEVYKHGEIVYFSTREFQLLEYLMENAGSVLTREQIFSHVWDSAFGDIGTVAVNIKSIRDKIDPENEYIKTVWGVGYKFEVL